MNVGGTVRYVKCVRVIEQKEQNEMKQSAGCKQNKPTSITRGKGSRGTDDRISMDHGFVLRVFLYLNLNNVRRIGAIDAAGIRPRCGCLLIELNVVGGSSRIIVILELGI